MLLFVIKIHESSRFYHFEIVAVEDVMKAAGFRFEMIFRKK